MPGTPSEPLPASERLLEEQRSRLDRVRGRIESACARAGRDPGGVRMVCVSKYRPIEQTMALYQLGLRDFGESRVQEAKEKAPETPGDICWHVIGPLQTNKAKYLPAFAHWVHSVDRQGVVAALEKAYAKAGTTVDILVQVNVAGEEQKGGVSPEELDALVDDACAAAHLRLRGLMTMAPYVDDAESVRWVFSRLRQLGESIADRVEGASVELSMGMTNDFGVAVEEGATMVRVGTALYEG